MVKNRSRRRRRRRIKDKNFDPHEMLSQVTILHHTDPDLAKKITRAILLDRAERGDFREPSLALRPEDGVVHVEL